MSYRKQSAGAWPSCKDFWLLSLPLVNPQGGVAKYGRPAAEPSYQRYLDGQAKRLGDSYVQFLGNPDAHLALKTDFSIL